MVFPIVELAIELGVPILHHASHSHYFVEGQPRLSDGGHLAELARRYPEAMLICAHISGGGDWEWTIKALRHASNVLLDTSGSVTDDGSVDMATAVVGVERVVFGCDSSMTAGVLSLSTYGPVPFFERPTMILYVLPVPLQHRSKDTKRYQ